MLNTKPFLCFDFGAGSVKVAEFVTNEAGTLALTQFGLKGLGQEGMQESKREAAVLKAIQELLSQKPYRGKQTNVCAPGYHVFSKFVKLPPVDSSKVTQIIQYEAQQNVPFPLEEVVWDYQIMGTTGSGELEVLLVAIKSDVVEGLFRTAEASNVRLQLVDVSPAASAPCIGQASLAPSPPVLPAGASTAPHPPSAQTSACSHPTARSPPAAPAVADNTPAARNGCNGCPDIPRDNPGMSPASLPFPAG